MPISCRNHANQLIEERYVEFSANPLLEDDNLAEAMAKP